jgi:hypothetical protein
MCRAWNMSLIAASTLDMLISLLPDCNNPFKSLWCLSLTDFSGWDQIGKRGLWVLFYNLQSSNTRQASLDTTATWIHISSCFQGCCPKLITLQKMNDLSNSLSLSLSVSGLQISQSQPWVWDFCCTHLDSTMSTSNSWVYGACVTTCNSFLQVRNWWGRVR